MELLRLYLKKIVKLNIFLSRMLKCLNLGLVIRRNCRGSFVLRPKLISCMITFDVCFTPAVCLSFRIHYRPIFTSGNCNRRADVDIFENFQNKHEKK